VSFGVLALITAVAALGPLLALRASWHIPVLLGELAAGIALGGTGVRLIDPGNPTLKFLAEVGFALVMFVAGSHVPVGDPKLRPALRRGLLRAVAVGIAAAGLGATVSVASGTGHIALYTVLMTSSSAALVLPVVDSLRLTGPRVLELLAQVAVADAVGIVALPMAIDTARAGPAAAGSAAIIISTALLYLALRYLERTGVRRRVHRLSENRKFALELRTNLVILFTLAALAVATGVSVMLAGFCFGIAVAAVGEPRRLARQLFALTEGFLGPLFFVWLGASLDVRQLGRQPSLILLGLALGGSAVAAHAVGRLTGQPLALAGLASAQLGVPVAAVTIGTQNGSLKPGESAALVLGAVVTVGVAVTAARWAAGRTSGTRQIGANGPM
jgi:Kef-type K+ transport system membrane component KefB